MALVPDQKFSTFFNGGALEDGDIVVGLREGLNTKFTWETPEGIDSITGTANQVLVDGTSGTPVTGDVTLTLPQNIATTSSPTFANLTLTGGVIDGINGNPVLTLLDQLNAVNSIRIFNNTTGNTPALAAIGTDTDVGLSLYSKGAGPIHLLSASPTQPFAIFSGTSGGHAIIFQMADTTATWTYTWPEASGTIALGGTTIPSIQGTANQVLVNGTSGAPVTGTAITLTTPQDIATTSNPTFNNLTLSGGLINGTNNHTVTAMVDVASAVNWVKITNSATANSVIIGSFGSDADVSMQYLPQGSGVHSFYSLTNTPVNFRSGTAFQHTTAFQFANTAQTRIVTFQDSDGTVAFTSDLTGFVTSVSGTANRITSTGGTTPVIDISASYVGQSSITTLGTIGTGVWQGTVIAPTYGGLGTGTPPSAGQIPIGNSGGTYTPTAINSGTNITVANGSASITVNLSGIISPVLGGTGVSNLVGSTITLGAPLTLSGAFPAVFNITASTNVTFPVSGTLATTASASGIVNSGTINQLTWYAASGTTVSGLATANNGLLVTSAAGVPSIGNAILADITINGISAGRGAGNQASNTAFGASALAANQAGGTLNSAFGNGALGANTTGDNNTAVGFGALGNCQADSASTAMGYLCLVNQNGGGGANTGYGFNCFGSVTLGTGNVGYGYGAGIAGASGAVALTTGTDNTFFGVLASSNAADSIGTLAIGRNAVADKATGATSADNGPGIAMGSAAFKVGFRGDGTIYPSTTGSGFWRQKINGTYYQTLLFADGSTGLPALTAPSITFSSTSGIIGTTTNNNAAAGSVGEFVESFVPSASAVSLTSTVNANVTTISLGAGDWDVSGHVGFLSGTTTNIVQTFGWTLDASASLPNEASYVKTQSPSGGTVIGANTFSYDVPTKRYSFTTTTTVYLSVRAEFSIAALSGYGYISARRRR